MTTLYKYNNKRANPYYINMNTILSIKIVFRMKQKKRLVADFENELIHTTLAEHSHMSYSGVYNGKIAFGQGQL